MSATATPPPAVAEADCAHCGAALADDQEWCLECGTARTLIHRAPDWRVPLLIVGAVATLVLAGVVVALVALSADANRTAGTPATTPAAASTPAPAPAATTPATSTPAPAATTATATTPAATTTTASTPAAATTTPTSTPTSSFSGWPTGLGGWTVVLGSKTSAADADALATKLTAAGITVGVLESSQHSSLRPGFWVVFSGRYPTGPDAQAAADRLQGAGQPQAHPKLVAPPGGQ